MNREKMAETIEYYRRYPDKFFEIHYPGYRLHIWQKLFIRALAKSEVAYFIRRISR